MKKFFAAVMACVLLAVWTGSALASTYVDSGKSFSFPDGISSVVEYNGYIYTIQSNHGLRVIDARDLNNIQDVTPDDAAYHGSYPAFDPVRVVYVQADKLYVTMNADNKDILQIYALADPAAPALLHTIPLEGGIGKTISADGDFAFVAGYAHLTAVNVKTGQYKIFNDWRHKDYKMIEYTDGYLYCITDQGGGKQGRFDIFDMRHIADGFPNNSVGNDAVGSRAFASLELADIEVFNGYALINGWASNWMDRSIYAVDISNPANVSEADMYIYPGEGYLKRINDMTVRNGMLFATDIDNILHMIDATDPADMREVVKQGLGNNHYTAAITDTMLIVSDGNALSFFPYYVNEVAIDTVQDGETITARPIRIGGTAPGANTVDVYVGGAKMTAEVDEKGRYAAEFDDEFIQSGENTVKATVASGKLTGETSVSVNIQITPPKYEIIDTKLETADGGVQGGLTIRNNGDGYSEVSFVVAAYRGQQMIGYSHETKAMPAGENVFYAELNGIDTDGIETAAYLIAKQEKGYNLLWQQARETAAPAGAGGQETGFTVDVEHENRMVNFYFRSDEIEGRDVLFMAFRPAGKSIDNLEYIGSAVGKGQEAMDAFVLPADALENTDYYAAAYAKGTAQYLYADAPFKYYGPVYIQPVLESIRTALPGSEQENSIGKILRENAEIFAIEMGQGSPFAALGQQYQNAVLEAIRGKDFTIAGSLAVKNAFNEAVAAQAKQEEKDKDINNALAAVNAGIEQSETGLMAAIREHAGILEIDAGENSILNSLEETAVQKVYARMKKAAVYTDITALKKDIEQFTALEYVNQTPYTQLGPVLQKVKPVLGLAFGKYPFQDEDQNAKVHREIVRGYDYETAAKLQNALTAAVDGIVVIKPPTGTGGGGGGGRPNISVPSIVDVPAGAYNIEKYTCGFEDLDQAEWAKTAITALAEKEVVSGKTETEFDPLANVTREEFVKMIVSAFAFPVIENQPSPFTDVSAADWSAPYILTAYSLGIVQGTEAAQFDKKANITRQDMAVILYRAIRAKNEVPEEAIGEPDFQDADMIRDYAKEAVGYMVKKGIMSGMGDQTFLPQGFANRAMAAVVIYNAVME